MMLGKAALALVIITIAWQCFAADSADSVGNNPAAPYIRTLNCEIPRADPIGEEQNCEILIVGGGWGGIHSAYALSKHYDGSKVS
jgi:heterodisulfide reductase subunit A-like polyferredoxin